MTTDNFLWVGPSHSIGNNGDVRAERAQFQKWIVYFLSGFSVRGALRWRLASS